MSYWILVCDASRGRIVAGDSAKAPAVVKQLDDPIGRAPAKEIVSDEPGRLSKHGGVGGLSAMDPRTEPHEIELQRHVRHLVDLLQLGLEQKQYDSLGLVAPPHLLGMLKRALNPQLSERLGFSVAKDLAGATDAELFAHLRPLIASLRAAARREDR